MTYSHRPSLAVRAINGAGEALRGVRRPARLSRERLIEAAATTHGGDEPVGCIHRSKGFKTRGVGEIQ